MVVDLIFKNLTRQQLAALLALTKDLGHERVVASADDENAKLLAAAHEPCPLSG